MQHLFNNKVYLHLYVYNTRVKDFFCACEVRTTEFTSGRLVCLMFTFCE